jgi:uncharacterized membrane protein SpoIIM required for sporulation
MPFCTNCGKEVLPTDNFCLSCGFDIRPRLQIYPPAAPSVTTGILGLGRNSVVYLSQDGLSGTRIQSDVWLFLPFILPLIPIAALYYVVQMGALAVYITVWVAASLVLYDELKWRGIQKVQRNQLDTVDSNQQTWRIGWRSIRMADWNGRTLWFSSVNPERKASVTFNQKDAPLVEQSLASWGVRYSLRSPRLPAYLTKFSTLVLLLFAISQAILILAATLPFFPGEGQMYTTILNNTQSQVVGGTFIGDFRDIFVNNIQVAWGGAIPFFGTFAFGLASYNTGRVIQVIAISAKPHPVPPSFVLIALYLLPHTWIEESAYPIATVAGILAVTRWRTVAPDAFARRLNRGSTKLVLAMAGVALILVFAGFIETIGIYAGYYEVLLWIPLAVIFYLFVMGNLKRRQDEPTIGSA